MMTNIEILKSFCCFNRLVAGFLHFFQNIFVVEFAGLVPAKEYFSKTEKILANERIRCLKRCVVKFE